MRKIRWSVIVLLVAILVIAMVGCNGIEIPSDAKITVTFETNGGTTIKPIVVTADTEFKMPKDPKKEGYTFAGWYLDAEFSQKLDKSYYNAHKGETPPEIPESITIYAKWFEGTHEHTVEVVDSQVETCTEDGFTLSVCSDPECNYIKVRTTEKLGHDLVTQEAQEPTCTEVGWDEYGACSRCDYTTRVEIEALGHDIKSTTLTDADCTNTGSRKDTCSRCDYSQTVTTPALGHIASDWITDTAASCEEEGTKHKECTVCHTTLGTAKIPQLEHIKSDWITTKEPTCTQKGTKIKECTICHFECEMTYIDVIGHNYVNGVCSECGATTVTNGLTYSYNTDTQSYTITDYTGSATEVVIPSTYNDGVNGSHPVTGIGNSAFRGSSTLTSVVIPDSVYAIGISALNNTAWYNNQPDGLIYAGKVAYGYKGNMPKNTEVELKEGTIAIAEAAFVECDNLKSITIPSSLMHVGSMPFFCCYNLTSITVNNGNTKYHSAGNCMIETASKTLIAGCATSVIPEDSSVTSINEYAFAGTGITSVTIPDSVTSIGKYSFMWCMYLLKVEIGDGVIEIGEHAFEEDLNLTSVVLGESVTNIGHYAFVLCDKLIEVSNKSALTLTIGSEDNGEIAYYAKNIYTEGQGKLSTDEDGYIIYTDSEDKLLVGYSGTATKLTLPDGITEIYPRAFYYNANNDITSVVIPDGVTSIGKYAFSGCTTLASITFPDSIEVIGRGAFEDTAWHNNQSGLVYVGKVLYTYKGTMSENEALEIQDGTTQIYEGAFAGWEGLTSITIPSSITSIGKDAFDNCINLASVNITDISAWCKIDFYNNKSNPLYYAESLYINGERPSGEIAISSGATSIPAYTFYNCTGLTGIHIPDSVTSIGWYAFYNCEGLTSVTISDSVTSIGDNAFSGCSSVTSITYEGTMAQWNAISKDSDWNSASAIKTIVCTDGTITLS